MKKSQRGDANTERNRPVKKIRGDTAESTEARKKSILAALKSFESIFLPLFLMILFRNIANLSRVCGVESVLFVVDPNAAIGSCAQVCSLIAV